MGCSCVAVDVEDFLGNGQGGGHFTNSGVTYLHIGDQFFSPGVDLVEDVFPTARTLRKGQETFRDVPGRTFPPHRRLSVYQLDSVLQAGRLDALMRPVTCPETTVSRNVQGGERDQ